MVLKKLGSSVTEILVDGASEYGPSEQGDDTTYDVNTSTTANVTYSGEENHSHDNTTSGWTWNFASSYVYNVDLTIHIDNTSISDYSSESTVEIISYDGGVIDGRSYNSSSDVIFSSSYECLGHVDKLKVNVGANYHEAHGTMTYYTNKGADAEMVVESVDIV